MKVQPAWRATAAWLRCAAHAISRFLGPFELDDAPAPARARQRATAPLCVSYGRATFCLHFPESRPDPGHRRLES